MFKPNKKKDLHENTANMKKYRKNLTIFDEENRLTYASVILGLQKSGFLENEMEQLHISYIKNRWEKTYIEDIINEDKRLKESIKFPFRLGFPDSREAAFSQRVKYGFKSYVISEVSLSQKSGEIPKEAAEVLENLGYLQIFKRKKKL